MNIPQEVPQRRYYESSPGFAKIDQLQRDLAIAMNPQLFFHINPDTPEEYRIPYSEEERLSVVEEIMRQITEALIEGPALYPFQQFENGLVVESLADQTVPRIDDFGTINPI